MSLVSNQQITPKLHSLLVTQSINGIVITIAYGTVRLPINLLWYGDFNTSGNAYNLGGKGLGKDGNAYDYQAAIQGLLCQGPTFGVRNIWGSNGRLTLQSASEPYTVPAGGGSYTVQNQSLFTLDTGVGRTDDYDVTVDDYGSPGPVNYSGQYQTSMASVSGSPNAGQYSQSEGTYNFSAEDAGKTVTINYVYSLYVVAETEDYNVPNTAPYEITVQNQPYFEADQGVIYVESGLPLVAVGGSPNQGQYNPNGGNYMFSAADATQAVAISYTWKQSTSNLNPSAQLQFSLIEGEQSQEAWSYLLSKHASQAIGYTTLAMIVTPNMDLGPSGQLPPYNFEVACQFIFGNGIDDADAASCIADLLCNEFYGAGFNASYLDSSLTSIARDYWNSNYFFISPKLDSAQPCAEIIDQWCEAGNVGDFWSEGLLKFIPYGDTTTIANGYVFTPLTSPIVDLDDDDFILADDGPADPVTIERTPWQDAYNEVKVQFTNRLNNYNPDTVMEQDDYAVSLFGLRPEAQRDYSFLCTQTAATFAANLQLKRNVYIRKKYNFTVSGVRYCMLEPMDLITLTDAAAGLEKEPVRIIEIEEDEDGLYRITAEEFPWGTATATIYQKQAGTPNPPLPGQADPGATNVALIFEPGERVAATISPSEFQLWMALNGGPNWGGCIVWMSIDGEDYQQIGEQNGPTRAGSLTANLPVGTDPDLTDVLSVKISGQLLTVSEQQADAYSTLAKIGDEYISYANAVLTASDGPFNTYNLTYLRRGVFSSPNIAHNTGDTFVRVDKQVFDYAYDPSLIGKTVYFKFTSFNLLKQQQQSLSDVQAYPHTIGGQSAATDMVIDSIFDASGTTATIRIYKNGGAPGTSGTVATSNGAIITAPAYSNTGYQLDATYYVNLNPSTDSYVVYTDYNQFLSDQQTNNFIKIGQVFTVGYFQFIPLQGGGTLAIGAGSGANGSTIQLPSGYSVSQMVAWAASRDGISSGNHMHGIQNCSVSSAGVLSNVYADGEGNTWTGDANWFAAAWIGGGVEVVAVSGGQFIVFTTSSGVELAIGCGQVASGAAFGLPSGFNSGNMLWCGSLGTFVDAGSPAAGINQCSVSGTTCTGDYIAYDSSLTWPGNVNWLAICWLPSDAVTQTPVTGGSFISFASTNGHNFAIGTGQVPNATAFGIPPGFSAAQMVGACGMATVTGEENDTHGIAECSLSENTFTGEYEDTSGHTWFGNGNFVAFCWT